MPTTATSPIKRERNWAWIWLGYTGFLFITPLIEPGLHIWLGTIAVFATFIAIFAGYVRATDQGHPVRFWMIAATFLLGLITFPWNPGASTFFVYAACFLPFAIPSAKRVLALFTAESVIVLIETFFFQTRFHGFHIYWPNALIAIFMVFVIGGGQIFFAEQKRAECKLKAAQEENIALAAVAERERIARDLHDVLGHTLSVIVLKAELAGRLLSHPTNPNPTRAAAEIADVERTARTALSEVREAIGGYRARGLAAEIEAARRTLDAAGVTLLLDSDVAGVAPLLDSEVAGVAPLTENMSTPQSTPVAPSTRSSIASIAFGWDAETSTPRTTTALTPTEETVLALALREAVTNIVRHARASTCRLRFVTRNGRRQLVIEDDGQHPIPREGNGLRGMRERIESLGGTLALERDRGTRLLIDLPLQTRPS